MANKNFRSGISAMALLFGITVLGCNTETGNERIPENNTNLSRTITVYMEKPAEWSQLYAYVWDDGGKVYTNAAPGTLLTSINGGYYSFTTEAEFGYVNVRFGDGNNSSIDVLAVTDDTWYKSAGRNLDLPSGSVLLLLSDNTSVIRNPRFGAINVTDSDLTLVWDSVPGIDGYVVYDFQAEWDDDGNPKPGTEIWHFQQFLVPSERELYDNYYGNYLDPETPYTWKLVAFKFKENADFTPLASLDPDLVTEKEASAYYNLVHEFNEITEWTKESSLSAPQNLRVVATAANSVELSWNTVPNADYYMVEWREAGNDTWFYIEAAYEPHYLDADEDYVKESSSYEYRIFAYNQRTVSRPSNEVTATTPSARAESRVTAATLSERSVTSRVDAAPSDSRGEIDVSWDRVLGANEYIVGLFTSQNGNPIQRQRVSGTLSHRFTLSSTRMRETYYVGVMAVGSREWKYTDYRVSAFPTIRLQSRNSPIQNGLKTITIRMSADWARTESNYGYVVKITDANGNSQYHDYRNTNTIVIERLLRGLYTVELSPYIMTNNRDVFFQTKFTYRNL